MSIHDNLPELDRLKAELAAALKREALLKAENRGEARALQEANSLRRQLADLRARHRVEESQ